MKSFFAVISEIGTTSDHIVSWFQAVEQLKETKENLEKVENIKKQLEEQNVVLLQEKNDLYGKLEAEQDSLADAEERIEQLVSGHVCVVCAWRN